MQKTPIRTFDGVEFDDFNVTHPGLMANIRFFFEDDLAIPYDARDAFFIANEIVHSNLQARCPRPANLDGPTYQKRLIVLALSRLEMFGLFTLANLIPDEKELDEVKQPVKRASRRARAARAAKRAARAS